MAQILILDDEESLRVLFRQILEDAGGYEVIEAFDAARGIQLVREHAVDLVITDIDLPDKSGLELIKEIVRQRPKTKIIAMTGSSGRAADAVVLRARVLGAQFAFVKPVRAHELLAAVRESLDGDIAQPG